MQSGKWRPFCLGLNVLMMDHALILIQNSARFSRQIRFLYEKCRIAIQISLKFINKSPIHKNANIGSDNGLAPNRRQTIIWTNDDLLHFRW